MFHQGDLFEQPALQLKALTLPALIDRISLSSKRPRYALLVLKLITQQAGRDGSLGPYVQDEQGRVPVRDWLCRALAPLAQRDYRRIAMLEAVRAEVLAKGDLPVDPEERALCLDREVEARILRSGRTSISRAVSELVRAGILRRHYQGYRIDHPNRGAQREAVYTVLPEVQRALSRH